MVLQVNRPEDGNMVSERLLTTRASRKPRGPFADSLRNPL